MVSGIAFHEFNPIFSQDGGHSLCTLDIPWGHAGLSPKDFERYLREIRPSEEKVAKRFYSENLNRMTTTDLRRHATDAGFTPLSILPWIEPRHFDELTANALADTKYSYPSYELTDLISPAVWVVLKKGKPLRREVWSRVFRIEIEDPRLDVPPVLSDGTSRVSRLYQGVGGLFTGRYG